MDKLLGFLSLARRAGALSVGFDATDRALRERCHLILIAADLAAGSRERIIRRAEAARCPVVPLALDMAQLSEVFNRPVGILGVIDASFARGLSARCGLTDKP